MLRKWIIYIEKFGGNNYLNFKNIHLCYLDNNCAISNNNNDSYERYNTEILLSGSKSIVNITDTNFENIYGERGIIVSNGGILLMINNKFNSCSFQNGLIEIDKKKHYNENYIDGYISINSSFFNNITSKNGAILNIKSLSEVPYEKIISFSDSTFINNTALNFGGVIYSISQYTNKYVSFENCTFKDNQANFGSISYSINKLSEPSFSNINELKKIKGAFVTNPSKIKINGDINNNNNISLFSGEFLPENITCNE
ncbi:hypothetical protein PIROE2DRAFT_3875 [Piromyces sp. E2]|nr:hypothetical protein PIROE2DRAFT_3875 [Piromyces sp. E2]|eukprot:OUM68427.1 hypothetical protein PIROE2DRAFT_3875 [Piromyces sp. E2]